MSTQIKPLTPEEVYSQKVDAIPAEMIQAVNNCLKKHYNGGRCGIKQDEIMDVFLKLRPEVDRHTVYDNKWMDFEPIFEQVGWKVEYDKPSYNESGVAVFYFSKSKK
jgi:hypothetical protein